MKWKTGILYRQRFKLEYTIRKSVENKEILEFNGTNQLQVLVYVTYDNLIDKNKKKYRNVEHRESTRSYKQKLSNWACVQISPKRKIIRIMWELLIRISKLRHSSIFGTTITNQNVTHYENKAKLISRKCKLTLNSECFIFLSAFHEHRGYMYIHTIIRHLLTTFCIGVKHPKKGPDWRWTRTECQREYLYLREMR